MGVRHDLLRPAASTGVEIVRHRANSHDANRRQFDEEAMSRLGHSTETFSVRFFFRDASSRETRRRATRARAPHDRRTATTERGKQTRVHATAPVAPASSHEPPSPLGPRNLRPRFGTMPAGKENARKRDAPAAPRPVLTIEVIEGPTKGQKFTKQVRPPAPCGRRARARHVDPTPTPPSRLSASRRCRGEALRKFPSRHTQAAFVASRFHETRTRLTLLTPMKTKNSLKTPRVAG